jgi:hypothetical protein
VEDGRPIANATAGREHFGAALTPLRYPKGLATFLEHEWPPYGAFPITYVSDSSNHRVCAFALAPLGAASSLSLPGPVSSAGSGKMVPLLSLGQSGSGSSDMKEPSAVAVAMLRDGLRVYVADTGHDR